MSTRSLIKIIILAVIPTALFSCKHKEKEQVAASFSMSDTMMAKCRFTKASQQDVKSELRLFGKVVADNNKQAQVYPVVSGSVITINAELGDYVKQGQILASIRSGEVAEYQKERLDAQSDVALAEKNLQVTKDMYAGKLNSEKDVMAAQKELEKSKAALGRINEVYHIYNLGSGSIYNITAPISGFIVNKDINQNEQLRSDRASALFSIAQIDEVWVLANVNESEIRKVGVGMEADIQTISYPDQTFKGKVDKSFNAIDPQTKAMKIRVRIPNTDLLLKPEMSATVNLRFSENKQMIAVPSSAVIFDKSKHWVMVFKSRTNIETRQVEVYRQMGDITYIKSGLKDGDNTISTNGLLIYDALND